MPQAEASGWLNLLVGPAGLTVGLVALVWALLTERLVPGPTCRRIREERDAALRRLERAVSVTGRAVEIADQQAGKRRED